MLNRVKNHGGALLLLHLELSDQEKIILVASSRIVFRKKEVCAQQNIPEKQKMKKLHGFSYTKNITNFKAFRWNNLLSAKLLLLKSVNFFFNQKIVVYIGTLHTYY